MSAPERHKSTRHLPSASADPAWRWLLVLAFTTFFLPTPELRTTSVPEQGSAYTPEQQPLALFSPTQILQDGPERPDLSTADFFEEDRMAQIKEGIAKSEYHIRYQEKPACLQSPNRAQDLRISYHTDGFSLTPRVEGGRWRTQLRVRSVGRQDHEWTPSPSATITTNEDHAEADHGTFKIQYENDERGMRQDFLVMERPEGSGPLNVTLRYDGDLMVSQEGEDDILFSSIDSVGNPVAEVWYKDLLAWDANNEPLHAWASVEADDIVLHVDDATAEYPVTIDPLSATASWIGEGNQAGAWYGCSVNTAGDVNGDGRSDIIIGARFYDGGATNGGRVFIYHGTPNGPNATANTTILSVAAEVALGGSVATAGDVNGDGYSDVVITRETAFSNSSAVFIHYGSPTGVSATPNTTITLGGVCCGTTAETAGDVNGDGYSDVIIADSEWSSRRGRAYIYHGSATGLLATPTTTISGTQNDGSLGNSVSSAGDVNNDGYSDVIIGQGHWTAGQQEEGRFFVHHGSAAGISATPNFTYESGQTYMFMGVSVSFAGDVNGDGYGDVIVGGPSYFDGSNTVGAAFVFYGSGVGVTATGMDLQAGTLNGTSFGSSVGCAGDVNGDGYADVIVGEPGGFTTLPGAAYVFLGTASGLSGTPVWTGGGVQAIAGYGSSVAGAGDVNGDGYSDVLVGAPLKESSISQLDEGHVTFYQGSPNGLSSSGTLDQTQSSAFFGTSVSAAGDVNGDGYSDVIVGAPQYDGGQTNEGRAYVYYGGTGGLPVTASWIIENNIALSLLGTSVSTAGDVNGNGYSDVIIGAPGAANGEAGEGLAYVYFGSAAGLGTTPWIAERNLPNAALGSSVASAGDVNGDGYSDVVIGANGYSVSQALEGAAYIHLGSATGLNAIPLFTFTQGQANARLGSSVAGVGDVTGDGYGDVLVGASGWTSLALTGRGRAFLLKGHPTVVFHETSWVVQGTHAGSALGSSVAGAGDVNGDGYQDLIIGEPGRPNGAFANAGRTLVFHGGPLVPSTTAAWTALGVATNAQFGFSVSKAGDVNKDGYGDVVVGSPGVSNGRIMVYHGSTTGLSIGANSTFTSSNTFSRMGTSVSNGGSHSGDGYGDVIAGAPDYDVVFPPSTDRGRVNVFNGNSGDTRSQRTRQYRSDQVTPVQTSNGTFDANCGWTIGQIARSHLGRRKMKLVWEIATHGPPFMGTPVTNSVAYTGQEATWTTVNLSAGVEIKESVIAVGTAYPKWRARLRHHPATMIDGQPFGPWMYMGIHDKQDPAIKVEQPACGLLPVELISFSAACEENTITLRWVTATEMDNDHFLVQRSEDTQEWSTMTQVAGAGNSQQTQAYAVTDPANGNGVRYYRLMQVDIDGTQKEHSTISIEGCADRSGALKVWPVPSSEEVYMSSPWPGPLELQIIDGTGRIIRSQRLGDQQEGNTIRVDTENLVSGQYLISCRSDEFGAQRASFIIAR